MRLYLDQMFRAEFAEGLRAKGHDVVRAAEAGQSTADDAEILRLAIEQDRTLVTLDEHFGDWALWRLGTLETGHFGDWALWRLGRIAVGKTLRSHPAEDPSDNDRQSY